MGRLLFSMYSKSWLEVGNAVVVAGGVKSPAFHSFKALSLSIESGSPL